MLDLYQEQEGFGPEEASEVYLLKKKKRRRTEKKAWLKRLIRETNGGKER